MVKGVVEPILIMTIIAAVFIIVSSIDLNIPWMNGKANIVTFHERAYIMDNALDAAEIYIDKAALYSLYQSCHENLYNPPLQEAIFFWNVGESMERHMNAYTSEDFVFLSTYIINLPSYSVDIRRTPILATVTTASDMITMKYEDATFNETIELQRTSEIYHDVPCYDIYMRYTTLKDEISADVDQMIQSEVSKWPGEGVEEDIQTSSCADVFESNTGKTIQQAKDEIVSSMTEAAASLTKQDGNYNIETEVTNVDVAINSEFIQSDMSGTICDFSYGITVSFKTTLTDTTKDYYVYDIDSVKQVNQRAVLIGQVSLDGFEQNVQIPEMSYTQLIRDIAALTELDSRLIYEVMMRESAGDPNAQSSADARGLMQLTSIAVEDLTVAGNPSHEYCKNKGIMLTKDYIDFEKSSIFDPEKNLLAGSCFLSYLVDKHENVNLALAEYNSGSKRIQGWRACINNPDATWEEIVSDPKIEIVKNPDSGKDCQMPQETYDYVNSILAAFMGYPVI